MGAISIFQRNVKWRFQNPITIAMSMIQPLIWLVLFSTLFGSSTTGGSSYTAFILPGIIIMSVLSGAGISGIANYYAKENGSFYRIAISPVSRGAIVIGHILDAAVLVFVQGIVLAGIAFAMSVRMANGIAGLLLSIPLLFAAVFFVASLSYIFSMAIPDENGFIAVSNTITLPLFFLSTALLEREHAPGIFKFILAINPFSYAINSLRNLITEPFVNWAQYAAAIAVFTILGGLAFIGAKNMVKVEK